MPSKYRPAALLMLQQAPPFILKSSLLTLARALSMIYKDPSKGADIPKDPYEVVCDVMAASAQAYIESATAKIEEGPTMVTEKQFKESETEIQALLDRLKR